MESKLVLIFAMMSLTILSTQALPALFGDLRLNRALPEIDPSSGALPWYHGAQNELKKMLSKIPITTKAKNIILFLGDGMSLATVTAARIMRGQNSGMLGEESTLVFDEFPYTGLSKTYCVDKQVADSACSATAYLGGVKTNYGTIGVTGAVKRKDCLASLDPNNRVESIAAWAQKAGKGTGIVTTTRVTHASPAGVYGHTAERDWESDDAMIASGVSPDSCIDLARQLVMGKVGKNLKVVLGGGRMNFLPNTTKDIDGKYGVRQDGLDLISYWKDEKASRDASAAYVTDKTQLFRAANMADYVLGLFNYDHMEYHLQSKPEIHPNLAEMTTVAIEMLKKEENGYFLFVEGGRIDTAHHKNLAHIALDETIQFAEAVRAALSIIDQDTLVLVTSDHAHTMSMSGYPKRGTDILGFGGKGTDNFPYSTLSYANGPGYATTYEGNGTRHNLEIENMRDINFTFPAALPMLDETHGGEDVGVFAHGPWAHLFTGVFEQNVIPHTLAYAACIGPGLTACSLNK